MSTTADAPVFVTFASRPPHRTCWLIIEAPVDADLTDLLADLAAVGWNDVRRDTPAFPVTDDNDSTYDAIEIAVCSPGTGLFTGWTDAEAAVRLPHAREVLAGYGFDDVPVWQQTYADAQ